MGYEKQGFADGQKLFASNLIAIEEGVINLETDYIVAEGTSGNWHYWKFANGWAICTAQRTVEITSWTNWYGEVYYSDNFGTLSYPFTFVAVPHEITEVSGDISADNTTWSIKSNGNTTSKTATILLARAGSGATNYSVRLNHFVIGRWK